MRPGSISRELDFSFPAALCSVCLLAISLNCSPGQAVAVARPIGDLTEMAWSVCRCCLDRGDGCEKNSPPFGVFLLLSVRFGVDLNLGRERDGNPEACYVSQYPVMPVRGEVCDVVGRRVRGAVRI